MYYFQEEFSMAFCLLELECMEDEDMAAHIEYERKVWIDSQQYKWFEAASPTIVNQAGLEGKNDRWLS